MIEPRRLAGRHSRTRTGISRCCAPCGSVAKLAAQSEWANVERRESGLETAMTASASSARSISSTKLSPGRKSLGLNNPMESVLFKRSGNPFRPGFVRLGVADEESLHVSGVRHRCRGRPQRPATTAPRDCRDPGAARRTGCSVPVSCTRAPEWWRWPSPVPTASRSVRRRRVAGVRRRRQGLHGQARRRRSTHDRALLR